MRAFALLALFAALSLCGCDRPKPWPIPELTLPPGSSTAPIPELFLEGDIGKMSEQDKHYVTPMGPYRAWGKGFNNPMKWEQVGEFVAGILRPMGYTPALKKYQNELPEIPGTFEREDYVRVWESPEGRFMVVLVNLKDFKHLNIPGTVGADYVLTVEPLGIH